MGEAIKVQVGEFTYLGFESPCPPWLKLKYREGANYTCLDCGEHESVVGVLEPHRIIRGCEGGLYTVLPLKHLHSNVKTVCSKCHQKYNYSRKVDYQK